MGVEGWGGENTMLRPFCTSSPRTSVPTQEPSLPVRTWTIKVWAGTSERGGQRPGRLSRHQLGLLKIVEPVDGGGRIGRSPPMVA